MRRTAEEIRRRRRTGIARFLCVWLSLLAAWLYFGGKVFPACFLTLTVLTPLSFLVQCAARKRLRLSVQTAVLPVQKEKPVVVQAVLQNRSVVPLHDCVLTVTCSNAYTGETQPVYLLASVGPKGKTEIRFEQTALHCGYLQAAVTCVTVFDWFGLLSRSCALQQPVSAGTPVFPDVYPVPVAVSPSAAGGFAQSERPTAQKGTDLSQSVRLRAFEPGDTLRQVHWKLSEKTGTWITREGTADGKEPLLLFWDPSGSAQSPQLADALASAVASVCYALLDNGIPFRFASPLSPEAAFDMPVTAQEVNTRILEAVRRQTTRQKTPDALSDGSRVLYFSIHSPAGDAENTTFIHCDDGCPAPGQPLRELIV